MLRILTMSLCLLYSIAARAADPPPTPFVEVPDFALPPPSADRAQIVFLEPINKIQGLYPVGIFVIDGDQRQLVNVSSWRSRSVIDLPPGKHLLFSAHGGHLLEANVEAGKRYHLLLRFIYANGFQLRPVRTSGDSEYRVNGPHFPKWLKQTNRWVTMSPDAEAYFEKFAAGVDSALAKARKDWAAKTPTEIAELTLNVEDEVPL